MKASDLREMKPEQVEDHLEDAREEYFKLRFQFATGGLPDTSRLRAARREIARIATVLRELDRREAATSPRSAEGSGSAPRLSGSTELAEVPAKSDLGEVSAKPDDSTASDEERESGRKTRRSLGEVLGRRSKAESSES